jgi:hypothetical protein
VTAKLLAVLVIALFVAGGVVFTFVRPWEARLGAAATARQLQARLRTEIRYSCQEATGADTELPNVDYLCEPVGHPEIQGYWVATNDERITDLQPTG